MAMNIIKLLAIVGVIVASAIYLACFFWSERKSVASQFREWMRFLVRWHS